MKGCFRISDGKFIEAQSDPSPGTMMNNAVLAGYDKSDLIERDISEAELKTILMIPAQ